MANLKATRQAQYVLGAEFTFNFDDTVLNSSGAKVDGGKTNTAATSVDIIELPYGATIVGGEVVTDTAFDAATFNVTVGDSGSAARYLGTTDRKGAGRTPLVPTGYVGEGQALRLTFTPADACTAGKMTVRVLYTVIGRGNENSF